MAGSLSLENGRLVGLILRLDTELGFCFGVSPGHNLTRFALRLDFRHRLDSNMNSAIEGGKGDLDIYLPNNRCGCQCRLDGYGIGKGRFGGVRGSDCGCSRKRTRKSLFGW